jgi:hypothetical protein
VIRTLLPWVTSAFTLLGMWLLSNKRWEGWVVGIANQVLWVATSIVYGTWGFLPLTAALLVIYGRGLVRWRRDSTIIDAPLVEG